MVDMLLIYLKTTSAYLNYKKVKFVVCADAAPVQKSWQRKENKDTQTDTDKH